MAEPGYEFGQQSQVRLTVNIGGGGMGDPHLRDPAHVARDVRDGLVTAEEAHLVYGVAAES